VVGGGEKGVEVLPKLEASLNVEKRGGQRWGSSHPCRWVKQPWRLG